ERQRLRPRWAVCQEMPPCRQSPSRQFFERRRRSCIERAIEQADDRFFYPFRSATVGFDAVFTKQLVDAVHECLLATLLKIAVHRVPLFRGNGFGELYGGWLPGASCNLIAHQINPDGQFARARSSATTLFEMTSTQSIKSPSTRSIVAASRCAPYARKVASWRWCSTRLPSRRATAAKSVSPPEWASCSMVTRARDSPPSALVAGARCPLAA